MGIDIGFDMVPHLEPEHQPRWEKFLDAVLEYYRDDPVIKHHQLEIEFMVGEHPRLPRAAYAFRRFSSKVSGNLTVAATPYIEQVHKIACDHFGDQVKFWSEYKDQWGHYGWDEVYAVSKKYRSSLPPETK